MVLTSHAIVGAALASVIPKYPLAGFVLGFASHFILDAIPHWDYQLRSSRKYLKNRLNDDLIIGPDFYLDLLKISLDLAVGFVLAFFIFGSFFWGMVGAVLPDLLQFVYFKARKTPLKYLQRFHRFVHADEDCVGPVWGIAIQVLLVLFIVIILKQ